MPVHKEGDRIVENPMEARAGFLDRPILAVLVLSTAGVIAMFGLIYLVFCNLIIGV